jgi:hypothetical protein
MGRSGYDLTDPSKYESSAAAVAVEQHKDKRDKEQV